MTKKLFSGFTHEEVEDMAETAGIDPNRLGHALTYMKLKRDFEKSLKAKKQSSKGSE